MFVTCLDLEGVLIPEIWHQVAHETKIETLKLTTRDIPVYEDLLAIRMKTLLEHRITLAEIQSIIGRMKPLDGAVDFLNWLKERTQVIILSDIFEEFYKPFQKKLNSPTIFCHSLQVDTSGFISSFSLRLENHKQISVEKLRDMNYQVIASGDSYNDISMLKAADVGILFRPPETIQKEFPMFAAVTEYDQLKQHIEKTIQ